MAHGRGSWLIAVIGIFLLSPVAARSSPARYAPDCSRPANREDAAYCVEARNAVAAENNLVLAKWQLVAGIFGAAFVIITLIYTRASTTLSRDSLKTEHRPWLFVKELAITSDIKYQTGNSVSLGFKLTVKNIGRTPALYCIGRFCFNSRVVQPDVLIDTLVDRSGGPRDGGRAPSNVIFPDEEYHIERSVIVPYDGDLSQTVRDNLELTVVGTVFYRSTVADNTWHSTSFTYVVKNKVDYTSNYGDVFDNDDSPLPWSDISPNDIRIVRWDDGWRAR